MKLQVRDTYKYRFKVGNLVVHCGITNSLSRREYEHKNSGRYAVYNGKRYYWSKGHIVQVGLKVTTDFPHVVCCFSLINSLA